TTASGRRSRRLYFLCGTLFRAERRRSDLRARGSASSLSPQKLERITRSSLRPYGTPSGALDDQAPLRPLVGLRSAVRIATPQLPALGQRWRGTKSAPARVHPDRAR